MIVPHGTNGGNGAEPPINDPAQYGNLSEDAKAALACFIELVVLPWHEVGPGGSYNMKHDFERAGGFYVSNGAFKGAMLAAGHEPINREDLDWQFNIKPTASRQQLDRRKCNGDWSGHYPLPENNPEGTERLAQLIDRALGRSA